MLFLLAAGCFEDALAYYQRHAASIASVNQSDVASWYLHKLLAARRFGLAASLLPSLLPQAVVANSLAASSALSPATRGGTTAREEYRGINNGGDDAAELWKYWIFEFLEKGAAEALARRWSRLFVPPQVADLVITRLIARAPHIAVHVVMEAAPLSFNATAALALARGRLAILSEKLTSYGLRLFDVESAAHQAKSSSKGIDKAVVTSYSKGDSSAQRESSQGHRGSGRRRRPKRSRQ